ncbi:MAG: ATP phosphoribosyltransferase, partial [Clostridia bacterium]|nr:ATP phosphoribosyltransferase [Clostridia bacterium]
CPEIHTPSRKLVFSTDKVSYFFVKPSDVPIYVERGVADVGVAGSDILMEYSPDVYTLLDLDIGKCRFCVAAPVEFEDDFSKPLRVATKFRNVATGYYNERGRAIDIIKLGGSIELAPVLGLSDVIVDIVETGTTLKENGLCVKAEIAPISARLIANKTAYKFNHTQIAQLADQLREQRKG